MRWPWGKPVLPKTDVEQALKKQEQAENDYREVLGQRFAVAELTSYLVERRALNHFGDDITISFRPRRNRA
jgi:hypothetical protein